MFQFKNSGLSIKEPDNSSALPNSFGKIRTFKEDLENFKGGGASEENTEVIPSNNTLLREVDRSLEKQNLPQTKPANTSENKIPDNNPFQSVPMPPPLSSPEPIFSNLKTASSQSFFTKNPPAQENIIPESKKGEPATPKKSKGKFILPIFVVFFAAAGVGFYYYWFYIKNNPSSNSQISTGQTPPAESMALTSSSSQDNNFQRLIIDTTKGPAEIKNAISKLATEFTASSAENDLIEAKVINKDNQPIGKKDFLSGFGLTIPETVLTKISESYSIFLKKEDGIAKLGVVFKTVTSSGLDEEMKKWESNMVTGLNSLYLEKVPVPVETAFNSSQYKNADIRYFNFSSPLNFSLDYSIISNFLVIGTSKDSMRSILDYMAEK